jgi:DNA-binding FadR family transcriptional regulator
LPNRNYHLITQVEEKLLIYIKEKNLVVGDKLPTEKVMKEIFNVGRSTLREAISRLVTRDVLETVQGSGTYVKNQIPPDQDPLGTRFIDDKLQLGMDFISVRLMLEPSIAALTAIKATKKQKEEIEKLCEKVEKSIKDGENHIEYDKEFHSTIARYSQNKVIENLIPLIHSSVAAMINVTNRTLRDETISSHRMITNAILDSDSIGAKNAMILHLDHNRRELIRLIKVKENQK